MKRLTFFALGFALAVPASAQVSGSINGDAPTVSSAIAFKNGSKIELSYTAIHFGKGMWMAAKEDEDKRERLNNFAPKKPIGKVSTTADLVAAGRTVPAGNYAMFFTVSERGSWILNLRPEGEGELIRWGLRLSKTDKQLSRMSISLAAGDKGDSAQLTVAFGDLAVSVPVTPGAAKDGAKPTSRGSKG